MHARALTWTAPWTVAPLATAHPLTAPARAFWARLLVLPKKLRHALACRRRRSALAHRPSAPQPSCPYAMLVPSDVRQRIEGLIP